MLRKKFDDEFKKQVVKEYNEGNMSAVDIAKKYDISRITVSRWDEKFGKKCNTEYDTVTILNQILFCLLKIESALDKNNKTEYVLEDIR